jgi:hypothetical protein
MEFLAVREELEREIALQTYHVIGVEECNNVITNYMLKVKLPYLDNATITNQRDCNPEY